jgi:arabinoxylan arabinofuranohydrolase
MKKSILSTACLAFMRLSGRCFEALNANWLQYILSIVRCVITNQSKGAIGMHVWTRVNRCVVVGGAFMLALAPLVGRAENPIIKGIYTADPSAHVFEGKMYLYPSHDRDDSKTWDMTDWHVYSSTDLVSWTDHGVILDVKDIPFGKKLAFAPDCGFKNGKYYFYFPVSTGADDLTLTDRIGVAIGDSPVGPFKCHPTPIISGRPMGFDPCIFIDDDGTSYIVSGFKTCFITKLKDNMVEAAEAPRRIKGAENFFEGVWMHKYNGKYYLSYSGRKKICYAIGDSPYGPFQYKGEIVNNGQMKDMSNTTHHSIVQYKGKWYMFYHNRHLATVNKAPMSEYKRSVCIDELHYNPDGTIVTLVPTAEGVKPVK